ncbi:MAG: glycosyltransferase family 9 protein [Thiothrix sp.]|uniref:glycosyltransferase family 9 protein n=1 Tax=Thiothrix sp. TaxID=1032 RepID=UPI002628C117|nr:glycosyltransferase family 9 protein [Thiothrix sp.]MDD5394637.1 glycosyltransferase family 9 protein [Thiothrix sp.]
MTMAGSRLWGRILITGMALWQLPAKLWRKRPTQVNNVLVLSHLLLGDTLMLTPLLKKIHKQYPFAAITLGCAESIVPLYVTHPYGVKAIGFNPRFVTTVVRLVWHCRGHDLTFVPGDNRWSWLALAMGSRWIVGFEGDTRWKNWPINELRKFPLNRMAWGDLMATLSGGEVESFYDPVDWLAPSCQSFVLPIRPYVVLHLGASKPHKYWSALNWNNTASWIREKGMQVVWSGGCSELHLLEGIHQETADINYMGKLDLAQLWRLLERAQALVCPDTGIAHLGRLTNTPTVALFGPGSPLISGAGEFWRNSPFVALWDENISCRDMTRLFRREIPWVKHCLRGLRECPDPHCMKNVAAKNVINALYEFLFQKTLYEAS